MPPEGSQNGQCKSWRGNAWDEPVLVERGDRGTGSPLAWPLFRAAMAPVRHRMRSITRVASMRGEPRRRRPHCRPELPLVRSPGRQRRMRRAADRFWVIHGASCSAPPAWAGRARLSNVHAAYSNVLASTITGRDATDDFESFGHSAAAREMLKDYYVGDFDDSASPSAAEVGVGVSRRWGRPAGASVAEQARDSSVVCRARRTGGQPRGRRSRRARSGGTRWRRRVERRREGPSLPGPSPWLAPWASSWLPWRTCSSANRGAWGLPRRAACRGSLPPQVAKHNRADDLWLTIDGKVYDVSKFAEKHPGGLEAMLTSTGEGGYRLVEQCLSPRRHSGQGGWGGPEAALRRPLPPRVQARTPRTTSTAWGTRTTPRRSSPPSASARCWAHGRRWGLRCGKGRGGALRGGGRGASCRRG